MTKPYKASVSAEWNLPLLAREDGYCGAQRCSPEVNLSIANGLHRDCGPAKSIDFEPVSIAEIFKEELSYRAQARRLLWESFD